MKHVKQYEEILGHFNDVLKKFILIKDKYKIYSIYEIDNVNYGCKRLFAKDSYEKINKSELLKCDGYFYKITNVLNFNDEIVYQSNKIDDVINHFEFITSVNKYNI